MKIIPKTPKKIQKKREKKNRKVNKTHTCPESLFWAARNAIFYT